MVERRIGGCPTGGVPRAAPLAAALLAGVAVLGPARAQDAPPGPGRPLAIEPYAALLETLTDHHRLDAGGESDAITSLTAGVGVSLKSSRLVTGRLDYRLTQRVFIRHRSEDALDQAFNGRLDGSWLDGRLGLTAAASHARQSLSLLGASSQNTELANPNTARVTNLSVRPSYNGLINPELAFSASTNWVENRVAGEQLGDYRAVNTALGLRPNRLARYTALADFERSDTDYAAGRRVVSDRVYGSVRTDLTEYDLRLGANAGIEFSNVLTTQRERYTTYAVQATWAPSPRLRADGAYGHRAYGATHQLALSYRSGRLLWSASSVRDLTVGNGQDTRVLPGDNAFAQLFPYLRSLVGDVAAAQLLLANSGNLDLTQKLPAGLLAGSSTVNSQQQLSVAWTGARNTATLSASRSLVHRVDPLGSVLSVLAQEDVRNERLNLAWQHKLMPEVALTGQASWLRTETTRTQVRSQQWQIDAAAAWQATREVSLGGGLRVARYDLQPDAYGERAVFASIQARY